MNKIDINNDWLFHKQGDVNIINVNLPHDAMIYEKRDARSAGGAAAGYFYGGTYIYEKALFAPEQWRNQHISIVFEGVYKDATVTVNGHAATACPYGYSPFVIALSELLNYGAENTIRVVADNSKMPNSRWYTGSGIYRPVWLYVSPETHIKYEGIRITTLSHDPARILVETEHTGGDVSVDILEHGKIVASGVGDHIEINIPDAKLWDADNPNMYQCRARLQSGSSVIDECIEDFGIRTVSWSPMGLFINGKETLLRGACVHHDNGILGARCYAESEMRRVRILKKAGFNAIRSSHNPASKAMLSACDKYGMYMIDETWDMWYSHKNKYDYASSFMDWYKHDIYAMISRDYNHPSVIMYSICNEVSEPKDEAGIKMAQDILDLFRAQDSSRAITGGFNLMIIHSASQGKAIYNEGGGWDEKKNAFDSLTFNMMVSRMGDGMNNAANSDEADMVTSPCLDAVDIAGYNYASGRYPLEGEKNPTRIIFGSETFPQDIYKNWQMVKRYPYLIGDFMWTGWDYIGEAGAGGWSYYDEVGFEKPYPWKLADCGAIDILGNIGAEAAYAATVWGLRDKPYIAVRPLNCPGIEPVKSMWRGTNAIASWAWHGCAGNDALIEVYADADSISLFLGGTLLETKKVEEYKALFQTQYQLKQLTAVSYDENGSELGRTSLTPTDGDIGIHIHPEKDSVKANEIVYVQIVLSDETGVIESNTDQRLSVDVENGELLAFGSANPRTEDDFTEGSYTTYYGRALAILRANANGEITVHVSDPDGNKAIAIISIE